MAEVTIYSDFGTVTIISPSICHEVMEPEAMILVFGMLDAWDKCSDLVHWEDLEGSGGEGGGRGDQDGEYMYI